MENVFVKYLSKQMSEPPGVMKEFGPVITSIQRFRLWRNRFSMFIERIKINKRNSLKMNPSDWTVISKEILEKSALELHSSQHMISHMFDSETRGFYAELIESFSGKYLHKRCQDKKYYWQSYKKIWRGRKCYNCGESRICIHQTY